MSHICPDIAFAISMVSQFMHSPRPEHFDVVYKILRYLKRALGKGYHLENVATYKLKSILMQIGWEISWIEDQHQVIEPLLEVTWSHGEVKNRMWWLEVVLR